MENRVSHPHPDYYPTNTYYRTRELGVMFNQSQPLCDCFSRQRHRDQDYRVT
jgi:hypothetical protein